MYYHRIVVITYAQLRSFETGIKLLAGLYLIHSARETRDREGLCNDLSSDKASGGVL